MSPLTQGRGLKQYTTTTPPIVTVAPHAGAWIETSLRICTLTAG